MCDETERKKKKQNKMDIFTDKFWDFEKHSQKAGSTFYIRIVMDTCA